MRVASIVREVCASCRSKIHAVRFAALVTVVEALVEVGRLSLSALGRGIAGPTAPKHGIKRVDRLLGNRHLWAERWLIFDSMIWCVLRGGAWRRHRAIRSRPVIVVDWTQTVGGQRALVAAVPIGGRALTLYFEVHPERRLGNTRVQTRFLRQLRDLLPPGCCPVIVSDAGFHGPFFREVRRLGWDFLGRLRGTAKARPIAGGPAVSKDEFYARASLVPRALGSFDLYTHSQSVRANLVLVRSRRKSGRKLPPPTSKEEKEFRRTARDPWLLVTSLESHDAAAVVALYAMRMQIEETFRDAKNHRFGWALRHVKTSSIERMTILLLITCLATIAVTLVGHAAERHGYHRAYQANTLTRRVLSFFVLGCAITQRADRRILAALKLRPALRHLRDAVRTAA